MDAGRAPRLRWILVLVIAAAAVLISIILATAGPSPSKGCQAAGWTGYVPLGTNTPGTPAYRLDGTFWIQGCGPIPAGP